MVICLNNLTRDIHEGFWDEMPNREFVSKIIIPLLKRAYLIILKIPRQEDTTNVNHSANSILNYRIPNLQNYAEGKRSGEGLDNVIQQLIN